jgi:hypothetical protein
MGTARSGRHVDEVSPRGYVLDYSELVDAVGPSDDRGLPLVSTPAGPRHSPALLAKYGLGSLELYLRNGNPGRRAAVETVARWLIQNNEEIPCGFLGWPMPRVPGPYAGMLTDYWFSGEAHSECISLLSRAAALLAVTEAEDCVRRAVGGLWTPIDEGGFARELGEGGAEGGLESALFVEQFPMVDRPSLVLGTHLRAMTALRDAAASTAGGPDEGARATLRRMERGLEAVLDSYDTGFWSRFDLDGRWRGVPLASFLRHSEHVVQLERLAGLGGSRRVAETAARWGSYAASPRFRARAWWGRLIFGVANRGRHPSEY